MRSETQQALNNILDCFNGTDGGLRFVRFKNLLERLDEEASKGDEKASELILLVKRFSKFIDVAQKTL